MSRARTMRPWVKICGLTSREAIAAALDAGADALGFVFHAASPRNLSPEAAATLARDVPRRVPRIAVTRHPSQALVDEIAATFRPDYLQTDAADLEALELPMGLGTIPVVRSGGAVPEMLPDLFLYEAAASGQGMRADWDAARRLARRGGLVLGGGLTAANVAMALAAVGPYGVDVSSGVESAPGVKDPARIGEFVAAARRAAAGMAESKAETGR